MKCIFLTIFILCLIPRSVFSQDLKAEYQFSLEFTNVILQVGHEIERENPGLVVDDLDKVSFEKIFKEKIDIFAEFYSESLEVPSKNKSVFLDFFRRMQINNVWDLLKVTSMRTKVLFKRKGFGVAIAVLMGIISDYVVPGILINIGLPHLIPVSAMTPWSMMYSTIPGAVERLSIKRKTIRAMGSKEKYLKFRDTMESLQKELRLKNPENFLYPLKQLGDHSEVIVVAKNTWVKSIMGKLGFFQDSVSYQSLLRFMLGNGITNDYVQYVMTLNADRQVKTTMLIQHILSGDNEKLKLEFRKKFSPHIFQVKTRDQWSGLMDWTRKMMDVSEVEELKKLINAVPESLDSREIVSLWEHMILPRYAENFDINYLEYRRLIKNFESMKGVLSEEVDKSFGEIGKDLFYDYFRKSFKGATIGSCRNSHQQVIKFLLRGM